MTIYYIAPYGAYRVQITEDMPEYAEAVSRMEEFFEEHQKCHMVNKCGRLNGVLGSYVVYA